MKRFYLGLGVAGILVFAIVMAFYQGKINERKIWELKYAEASIAIAELEGRAAVINEVIVTEYVDRVQYVDRVRIRDRVVREYVTVESDANCTINNGFVVVHNAAATLTTPVPSPTDVEDSDVQLSQVAITVADNYAKYHQVVAQLEALQNWIREQQKLWKQYD